MNIISYALVSQIVYQKYDEVQLLLAIIDIIDLKNVNLSGIDLEKTDNLFEPARRSSRKWKEDIASGARSFNAAIYLEPISFASPENVRLQDIFSHREDGNGLGKGFRPLLNSRVHKANQQGSRQGNSYVKPINPSRPDGQPLTCHGLDPFCHLIAACPHSYEIAQRSQRIHSSVHAERVTLFTGYNKVQWKFFMMKQQIDLCLIQLLHQPCVARDGFSVMFVLFQKMNSQV